MRSGEARGIRSHRRQSRRIVEQPVDLVGEHRQVVAADRRPLLEQVVGSSAPPGRGSGCTTTKTRPRASASEVVRPPGLPTTRSEAAMYSSICGRVADDLERDAGRRRGSSGRQAVELGLQLLVAAADRDDLGRVPELAGARRSGRRSGPTPKPPAEIRITTPSRRSPCFSRIARWSFGSAKTGSIGMPETVTLLRRDPQLLQVGAGLVERDEVVVVVRAEPLRVDVEVGDDDRLPGREPPLRRQPGDDLGRQEMGADRDVGLVPLQQLDERAGVELVEAPAGAGRPSPGLSR